MFINRKMLIVLLAISLLLTLSFAVAQDGFDLSQSYTSPEGIVTVHFPSSWVVEESDDGQSFMLKNSVDVPDLLDVYVANQIGIQISYGEADVTPTSLIMTNAPPITVVAFAMGAYTGISAVIAGFSNQELDFEITRLEETEIDGRIIAFGEYHSFNSMFILYDPDTVMLIAAVQRGNLDIYRPLIMAIWDSIEYSPITNNQ